MLPNHPHMQAIMIPAGQEIYVPHTHLETLCDFELNKPSPLQEKQFPVLTFLTDPFDKADAPDARTSVISGGYNLQPTQLLAFRYQVETSLFVCIASPQDPDVIKLVHAWRKEESLAVNLQFGGRSHLRYGKGGWHDMFCRQFEAMQRGTRGLSTEDFIEMTGAFIGSKIPHRCATSDIPGITRLDRVEISLLVTPHIRAAGEKMGMKSITAPMAQPVREQRAPQPMR